jgi:hypothetical protein
MGTVKEGRTSQVGEDDTRPCEDDGDDLTEDGELQVPDERMVLALLVEVGEKWRGRSKREREGRKETEGKKTDLVTLHLRPQTSDLRFDPRIDLSPQTDQRTRPRISSPPSLFPLPPSVSHSSPSSNSPP